MGSLGDERQSLRSCLGWSWLCEGHVHALGHQHVHRGLVKNGDSSRAYLGSSI